MTEFYQSHALLLAPAELDNPTGSSYLSLSLLSLKSIYVGILIATNGQLCCGKNFGKKVVWLVNGKRAYISRVRSRLYTIDVKSMVLVLR